MKKITLTNLIILCLTISVSQAQTIINPIGVTTSVPAGFGSNPMDVVNGQGLSNFPSTTADHATSLVGNSLQYLNASNIIVFDLGGSFDVEGFAYWNGTSNTTDYGVKDVIVSSSTDGVNFTIIPGAPSVFAQATLPPNLAEMFSFTPVNATHIQFEALNNHGNFLLTIFSEVAFLGATQATGNVINPVSATTTLSPQFGSTLTATIDGTGLDAFPSLTASHEATNPFNSFLATNDTGSIDFDLGGNFLVDGFSFWNENTPGPGGTGINDVLISSSSDGITYTPIAGAPVNFARVMNPTSIAAEQFSFPTVSASHIRIHIVSNHGDPGNLVAFAEIAFSGLVDPLSANQFELSNSIDLYPNPAENSITVSNSSNFKLEGVNIFDMNGRLIRKVEITNSGTQRIDTSDLLPGLYMFQVYGEEGSTVKRVIKS